MRNDGTSRQSDLLKAPSRRSAIDPFIVMDVMRAANARDAEAARTGGKPEDRVIHMEVGQPGTPAPRAAREAALRAMEGTTLGYTEALGLPELRARIARLYKDWYGVGIAPERVIVTAGSSGAFILAFLSLFDAGDTLALPAPGYPCYRHISNALGLNVHTLVTSQAGRWMPDAKEIAELAAAGKISGLLLASPANPTGTMLAPDRLAAIAQTCAARGIWFISDEIYHGLTYEGPARTALQYSDQAIVINSFSKYFSMTGWRIGWMVVPEGLVRPIERLAQNLFICPPAIAQHAALGAFDATEELEGHRKVYAANRAILLEELPKAGLTQILPADGAFYVYADISGRAASSRELTKRMLDEIGIAATPGNDFDPARGEQFVRFSYAGNTADIAEAARRLKGWLGNAGRTK
jgi:aspartate/methionine/tyrosine aminotransferase